MSCSCKPLIQMKNVNYSYGNVHAVANISGTIYSGSLTAVAGPNGAGKSTFLKLIAGIIRAQEGSITIDSEIKNNIGYLPQINEVEKDYPINVWQAISTGLWPRFGSISSLSSDVFKEKIKNAIYEVGLTGLEKRQTGDLSGGQFQRLLFARLLLQDTKLVLLDEPFASVDGKTTKHLMKLLLKWHDEGKTIICVLHDLMLIKKYFPQSFVLEGKCLGVGHTHELFDKKLLSFDLDMVEITKSGEHHEHH